MQARSRELSSISLLTSRPARRLSSNACLWHMTCHGQKRKTSPRRDDVFDDDFALGGRRTGSVDLSRSELSFVLPAFLRAVLLSAASGCRASCRFDRTGGEGDGPSNPHPTTTASRPTLLDQ